MGNFNESLVSQARAAPRVFNAREIATPLKNYLQHNALFKITKVNWDSKPMHFVLCISRYDDIGLLPICIVYSIYTAACSGNGSILAKSKARALLS